MSVNQSAVHTMLRSSNPTVKHVVKINHPASSSTRSVMIAQHTIAMMIVTPKDMDTNSDILFSSLSTDGEAVLEHREHESLHPFILSYALIEAFEIFRVRGERLRE